MPDFQPRAQRALVTCGVWLHAGLVGATAVAAGLIRLFDGQTNALSALALAILGALVAAVCWRRARIVLERAAPKESSATGRAALRRRDLAST